MLKKVIGYLLIFLTLIILAVFIIRYHFSIKEIHNVESYFSKDYIEYNGGKDAELFFDEYVYTEKYKDIAFHYCDAEKKISWYDLWTVFVLDIYYEEDEFNKIYNEMVDHIGGYVSNPIMNGFVGCKIDRDDTVYENNSAFVLLNPHYSTIRYIFVCNLNDVQTYDIDFVGWSFSNGLNWNRNNPKCDIDSDWIFDYSSMVDTSSK